MNSRRDSTGRDDQALGTLVLMLLIGLGILLAFVIGGVGPAHGQYAPGDTLWLSFAFPDSDGVAILPDSARAIVYLRGAVLDSAQVYPGSMAAAPSARSAAPLAWDYVIPAAVGTLPVDLDIWVRASGDGFSDDWLRPRPSTVRVNGLITIDSLTANAIADYYTGEVATLAGLADSSSCTTCGVYYGGNPVTGAPVYITSDSTLTNMTQVLAYTTSVAGYWRVRVPLVAGRPDTVWVHSYYAGRYQPLSKRIIFP